MMGGATPPGGGFGNTCQNYGIKCRLYRQCRTLERRKNTTPHDTTHFTHPIWTRSLRIIKIGTCLCAYSIQNVNSYEPVPGTAQYHTVLITRDFMLVTFMYFRIFILVFEL